MFSRSGLGSGDRPAIAKVFANAWRKLRNWSDRPWPAAIASVGMVAGGLFAGIAAGQSALTISAQTGLVVVANNGSGGMNAGDTLTWIAHVQPPSVDEPLDHHHELRFDVDLPYVKGSLMAPKPLALSGGAYWKPSWQLQSGVWVSAEPSDGTLIKAVRFDFAAPEPPPPLPEVVNFSGTGDGYEVTAYKTNLYIANHHSYGNFLNCRVANNPDMACPGIAASGVTVPLFAGDPFVNDPDYKVWTAISTRPIFYKDVAGHGRLYIPVVVRTAVSKAGVTYNAGDAGFVCADLDSLKSCGFTRVAVGQLYGIEGPDKETDAGKANNHREFESVGNFNGRAYAFDPRTAAIYCFMPDSTSATGGVNCSSPGWKFPSLAGDVTDRMSGRKNSFFTHPSGIVVVSSAYRNVEPKAAITTCFNVKIGTPCGGSWPVVLKLDSGEYLRERTIAPRLGTAGEFKGFCYTGDMPGGGSYCYTETGVRNTSVPASLAKFLVDSESYWDMFGHPYIVGTKVFVNGYYGAAAGADDKSSGMDQISCFDFSVNAACTGFPVKTPGIFKLYTVVPDAVRPNCIWALGDAGYGTAINMNTGGTCSSDSVAFNIVSQPLRAFPFDPNVEIDTYWDKVVLSNSMAWGSFIDDTSVNAAGVPNGVEIVVSALNEASGGPGATLKKALLPVGAYTLPISDIKYRIYPQLYVSVTIRKKTGAVLPAKGRVDVSWRGQAMEFGVKTSVPSPACALGGVFTARFHRAGSNEFVAENVSTSNALVLGASNTEGLAFTPVESASLNAASSVDIKAFRFSGSFNESVGSGSLDIYQINSVAGSPSKTFSSSSVVQPKPGTRVVLTSSDLGAVYRSTALQWNKISAAQRFSLQRSQAGLYLSDAANKLLSPEATPSSAFAVETAMARLDYLRGEKVMEASAGIGGSLVNFRPRSDNTMGMPIGSGVSLLLTSAVGGTPDTRDLGYATFVQSNIRGTPMVFMNGNDGFVHAWKKPISGSSLSPTEAFRFMPGRILLRSFSYVQRTSEQLYRSPHYLDNSPVLIDIDLSNGAGTQWRTLLLSTMGRGAPGGFALDVTRADLVNEGTHKLAMFEVTDRGLNPSLKKHMGYIISPPALMALNPSYSDQVVKVKSGSGYRYAWLLGNGVDSQTGSATLFIVYLDAPVNGEAQVKELVLDAGPNNGLSTPRAMDTNGDGIADVVFAGDIKGNLWRIDISDPSAPSAALRFSAGRPIVSAPLIVNRGADLPPMIVFGTGSPQVTPLRYAKPDSGHKIYGLVDKASPMSLKNLSVSAASDSTRVVSAAPGGGADGWVLTLPESEAVIGNPTLHPASREAVFVTTRPPGFAAGVCSRGWSYEYRLDAVNGSAGLGFQGEGVVPGVTVGRKINQRVLGMTLGVKQGVRTSTGGAAQPAAGLLAPPYRGRVWWREVNQ